MTGCGKYGKDIMKITAAAGTNVGRIRKNNEDNFYINGFYKENTEDKNYIHTDDKRHHAYTYAVCDGVGGAEFGELASLFAVEELYEYDGRQLEENFAAYIEAVNRRICDRVVKNGGKRMGSTAALLFIKGKDANICNIGDSRVYLIRDGEMTRLTHDHTRMQSMIDSGLIKDEEEIAKDHVLTQFLGVFPEEFRLDPYIGKVRIKSKDIFLLCSDGLTDMVPEEEIRQILLDSASESAEEKTKNLISAALGAGGRDNITTIVVMVK